MMKKLLIPLSVGILIIFSSLSFSPADSLDLENTGAVKSARSSNLDLILTGEGLVHLVNNDIVQPSSKFIVGDSVMDSNGNTYLAGNLRDAGIVLGDIPRVNLNDDISRNPERSSPVIAKIDSNGVWIWLYYPVPKAGSECDGESFLSIDDSYAYANSISLSTDDSRVSFAGEFSGCYDFGFSPSSGDNKIYNEHPVLNGYVANLNTSTGGLDWVLAIQHSDVGASFGGLFLTSIGHSDKAANSDIYVGGMLKSLTIDPENSAAGNINPVIGDDNGDAYFAVISQYGELLFQADSCVHNDLASGGGGCNSAGSEKVVSVDVYGDSVMLGIEVDSGLSNVELFDSDSIANPQGKVNPIAVEMDSGTYALVPNSAYDLNDNSIDDEEIIDSIVVDEEVIFLVRKNPSQGSPLPLRIVNVGDKSNTSIFATTGPDQFIAHGFVHGHSLGTHLYGSWTSSSPVSLEWRNATVTNGVLNLNQGDYLIDIDDLSRVSSIPTSWNPSYSTPLVIANNHEFETSIFGVGFPNYRNIVQTYSHDSDSDEIPDRFDTFAFIPSGQDKDSDSVLDEIDNCPVYWNLNQFDLDNDGAGDVCDGDVDGDGISNNVPVDFLGTDLCPYENASGSDSNADGCIDSQGNTFADSDDDGVLDSVDTCPDGDDNLDTDNDGIPNACDTYQQDWDNDGVNDDVDVCQGHHDSNDSDDDGIPLGCDEYPNDSDNDGVQNQMDNCVLVHNPEQSNLDDDVQGDACDGDIDGDGVSNLVPLNVENSSNLDQCPYSFVSNTSDLNGNGCADDQESIDCQVCDDGDVNTTTEDENDALIDPDDVATVAVVGGGGIVGGGLLTLLGTKVRRAMSFVGIDDGLEALKHLPHRKKKDQGSDHYFQKGVTRQQEMSLSADKNLDDYIEEQK